MDLMFKTYLYIPEKLNQELVKLAKRLKKSKAEVMREALEDGVKSAQKKGSGGAEIFLKIAALGKKHNVKGPKDGAEKMDDYLWGKDWDHE